MPADPPVIITFSGEFRHALDGKNRITIPADWRRIVPETEVDEFFVIPDKSNHFLFAMPPKDFHGVREVVNSNTALSAVERQTFIRGFYAKARRCVLDRQGRLVLPEEQCRQAGLQEEVLLVGVHNKFEIWNPEAYGRAQADGSAVYNKVSELIVI
jgi:MraZ protein